MARFLPLALMVGMALWEASPVEACTCVVPTAVEALETSDLVVTGRVVKAEPVSAGLIGVDIAVEHTFKGDARKSIRVFTRPSGASCYEFAFQAGERYLVVAMLPAARSPRIPMLGDLPDGEYITGVCTGTVPLGTSEGRDRLRGIQQHAKDR